MRAKAERAQQNSTISLLAGTAKRGRDDWTIVPLFHFNTWISRSLRSGFRTSNIKEKRIFFEANQIVRGT